MSDQTWTQTAGGAALIGATKVAVPVAAVAVAVPVAIGVFTVVIYAGLSVMIGGMYLLICFLQFMQS